MKWRAALSHPAMRPLIQRAGAVGQGGPLGGVALVLAAVLLGFPATVRAIGAAVADVAAAIELGRGIGG